MRVLVTGSSGFIGGYVIECLGAAGNEVIAFDRHAEGDYPAWVTRELGDVRDFTSVASSMAGVDGFIHLAGVLGTAETVWDPEPAVRTNIDGSLNVFKAARRYETPGVYIAVGNYWMNNSYSISKTTAERFAFMFNAEYGTYIAVVRALNAYGPRQKAAPVRKIMPNLVLPALTGRPIIIYGSGDQVMDMVYVADVAEILVRALEVDHQTWDRPFEAGTGRRTTVNDVAGIVARAVADWKQIPHEAVERLIEHVPMRAGEEPESVVLGNPDTLSPLGIYPEELVPLEEGIARTVEWYGLHEPTEAIDALV